MADFLASSQALNVQGCEWLADIRKQAQTVWQSFTLPTRKTEDWKYTNVSSFKTRDFFTEKNVSHVELATVASLFNIADLNAITLVFINGVYESSLSNVFDVDGLSLCRFDEADTEQQAHIGQYINSVVDIDKHGFAALNGKSMQDGVFIHAQKNTDVNTPVHIVSLTTEAKHDFNVNARVLVVVEQGANATVVEHFTSTGAEQSSFTNSITECVVKDNASLIHYRLHEEQEQAIHIGGVHTELHRDSRLNSFYLTYGSKLKRIDISVNYAGEGGDAVINGVYLPKNKQHVDFHTCIEHAVPRCTSSETFRGIISDEARAVFAGRIHIHRDAQKSEAYLSNKNLLTSNKAEVDTKPELEIYADDVRCAHGATVAQLDPTSVHYLKTRGISGKEALVMLSFGFINELLNDVKHDAIMHYCRPKIATLFARDPELARHLL